MHNQMIIAENKRKLIWASHRKLVVLLTASLLAALALIIPVIAYMNDPTAIQGQVRDANSGAPIADALIEIPALGLSTRSNSRGEFSWSGLSISGDFQAVTVQIQGAGYGNWTLENVRILRAETLILEAELKDTPQTITVPPPSNERPMSFAAAAEMAPVLFALGGAEDIPIPDTIRVRVTGDPICNLSLPYTVEVIDFKEYVKHVLPNEWISSWPWESLRSGAMATKMYAWYWVAAGGKWSDADVYDSTCDQVYNPAVSYASTNQAVDDTWNWRLTRDDLLIQTQYRAYASQCGSADCMGQWDSRDLALGGWIWDEILFYFYEGTALTQVWNPPGGYSLRFDGVYNDTENRVLIPLDDPATSDPGPPVDVGGEDFTIEFWIKASPGENNAPAASCGSNTAWQQGNLLFDRDRNGDDRDFGLSLADGRVVFGVSGDGTGDLSICGTSDLADDNWHHVAVQRRFSDGYLWLYVDGVLETEADGPEGDISYPDDAVPPDTCGPSGTSSCTTYDPMLAIGAEKHRMDAASPSFNGWLDEIRFSNVLRYSADFSPPADPFVTDANTVVLYKLNEGYGNLIRDTSEAIGGPSDGTRIYGGSINGPEWSLDTFWYVPPPTPTPTPTNTPTPTPTPTETLETPTPTPVTPTPTPVTPTPTPVTPTPTYTPTATPTPIFEDVPTDHWAFDYINSLFNAGYIAGCSTEPRLYCPDNILSRAESAVFVLRGQYGAIPDPPHPTPATPTFTDVDPAFWGFGWVESLWTDGFTAGCNVDPRMYCPDTQHSRAEGSVFFLRVKNGVDYVPPTPTGIFTDVDLDAWYAGWVEAAFNEGILPECSQDPLQFCPENQLDRAWAAYMMIQAKGGLPLP